jgi:hypothetical protein
LLDDNALQSWAISREPPERVADFERMAGEVSEVSTTDSTHRSYKILAN